MKKSIGAGLIALSLAACGGGGGGAPAAQVPVTPTPPATPAPTVTLAISQPKVTLGSSVTLTWSSTNATSCAASGAWSGTQAISGTSQQTPTTSGQLTYTLTCTGAGGTANQSVALAVPIPVQKSSYLNAKNIGLSAQSLPVVDPTFNEEIQNGYAFADFFQEGTLSLVTFTEMVPLDGTTSTTKGKVRFYKKGATGGWQENTTAVLSDTTGCITPRKLVVADFNNDGIPDVFASCHGLDGNPYPGESPHVLLSQPDGTFKNVTLSINCFCHGATAADLDGDGNVDIVVADFLGQGGKTPLYALMGDGKGGFKLDYARIDRAEFEYKAGFFSVELVQNAAGKYDLLANGTDTYLIPNDGKGNFVSTTTTKLPTVNNFEGVMDFVVDAQSIYTLRVMTLPYYGGMVIQKIDRATGVSSVIYNHTGTYGNYLKFPTSWFSWMVPINGNLVSENAFFNVTVPQ